MTKKEKDKLKKKQERLDHCLELLEIDEKEFLTMFRDDPSRVRIDLRKKLEVLRHRKRAFLKCISKGCRHNYGLD